jgi:hypothetical protein
VGLNRAGAWRFHAGYWPVEGLYGENSQSGASVYFSLETPFASWAVRNATQLPNGTVVFQLGSRQICVVDPETKRTALLGFGRGPVAVLKSAEPDVSM